MSKTYYALFRTRTPTKKDPRIRIQTTGLMDSYEDAEARLQNLKEVGGSDEYVAETRECQHIYPGGRGMNDCHLSGLCQFQAKHYPLTFCTKNE